MAWQGEEKKWAFGKSQNECDATGEGTHCVLQVQTGCQQQQAVWGGMGSQGKWRCDQAECKLPVPEQTLGLLRGWGSRCMQLKGAGVYTEASDEWE